MKNNNIILSSIRGYDKDTLVSNEFIEINRLDDSYIHNLVRNNISNSVAQAKIKKFTSKRVLVINLVDKSRDNKELPENYKDGSYDLTIEKSKDNFKHNKSYTSFKNVMKYCIENRINITDVKIVHKLNSSFYGALIKGGMKK